MYQRFWFKKCGGTNGRREGLKRGEFRKRSKPKVASREVKWREGSGVGYLLFFFFFFSAVLPATVLGQVVQRLAGES